MSEERWPQTLPYYLGRWRLTKWISEFSALRGQRLGGGRNVARNFGEGEGTVKHALQNHFWRPQKLVWSVPLFFKWQRVAYRLVGRGSKHVFGEGFHGMSPPPVFHPPLCRSLTGTHPKTLKMHKKHRVYMNFLKKLARTFASFSSQEPNRNCSEKNCSDELS